MLLKPLEHRDHPRTLAGFLAVPEARSALAAIEELLASLDPGQDTKPAPVFLHGSAGTGKSHLAAGLQDAALGRFPQVQIRLLAACDFAQVMQPDAERACDLWIVEDVQHLAERPAAILESFVQIYDDRQAHARAMLFTANVGPGRLAGLPNRVISRLAGGVVVGLEPMQAPSRRMFLHEMAQRRQMRVSNEVLAWLADHVPGTGRQLLGALAQLETLARLQNGPLDVPTVAGQFREQAAFSRTTVERIAQRVCELFHLEPRQLQSGKRYHNVLLPRQVSMYLARQLTDLSLEQIGAYFGGRDHTTVLHACRKIEAALGQDAALDGIVRQLNADLR